MPITIVSTHREDPADPQCIAVNATGPKGGKIEWCLFFHRNGALNYGYCYQPHLGYQAEHLISSEIKEAARAFYERG